MPGERPVAGLGDARIKWVVRRDIVEPHDGRKHVHYLTKWTADVDRVWCTSCWTKNPEHATPWDEDGARFAATLVGGYATPRVATEAS